jgi:Type IV secretion-system coupling protein DNA-binding domain
MKEANLMRTSETHRPRQWRAACALLLIATPLLAYAQAAGSPFMTGATALESNILAWLTPIAIILVMALGALAMANRIVENCANTLIFRCSGSEHGGTSQFASRLIGEREVLRRQSTRGRDHEGRFGLRGARRSHSVSEQAVTETAVLAAELEQLPDFSGYLKTAGAPEWRRVRLV